MIISMSAAVLGLAACHMLWVVIVNISKSAMPRHFFFLLFLETRTYHRNVYDNDTLAAGIVLSSLERKRD